MMQKSLIEIKEANSFEENSLSEASSVRSYASEDKPKFQDDDLNDDLQNNSVANRSGMQSAREKYPAKNEPAMNSGHYSC